MRASPYLLDRDLAPPPAAPAAPGATDGPSPARAAALAAARAEGHAEGRAAERAAGARADAVALDRIAAALDALDGSVAAAAARTDARLLAMVRTLFARLAPVVVARAGAGPALRHVRTARRLACGSPWLRVTVSPAVLERHGADLARALAGGGEAESPRAEIVADAELEDGAARVEWRGGRSDVDPARLTDRLAEVLRRALPEETPHE